MSRAAKWSILGVLIAALVAVSFAVGVAFERRDGSESQSGQTAQGAPDFDALNEIYGLLQRDYVDPSLIDGKTLSQAAINGMVKSLTDTGTYYVDPQTYNVSVMPTGTFEGIGANVTQQNGKIVIVVADRGHAGGSRRAFVPATSSWRSTASRRTAGTSSRRCRRSAGRRAAR